MVPGVIVGAASLSRSFRQFCEPSRLTSKVSARLALGPDIVTLMVAQPYGGSGVITKLFSTGESGRGSGVVGAGVVVAATTKTRSVNVAIDRKCFSVPGTVVGGSVVVGSGVVGAGVVVVAGGSVVVTGGVVVGEAVVGGAVVEFCWPSSLGILPFSRQERKGIREELQCDHSR